MTSTSVNFFEFPVVSKYSHWCLTKWKDSVTQIKINKVIWLPEINDYPGACGIIWINLNPGFNTPENQQYLINHFKANALPEK